MDPAIRKPITSPVFFETTCDLSNIPAPEWTLHEDTGAGWEWSDPNVLGDDQYPRQVKPEPEPDNHR